MASSEDSGARPQEAQNALSALVEYVPAETITLYLAVATALPVIQRAVPLLTTPVAYWGFLVLTPILFILIYGGKRKAQGDPRLPDWRNLPWWPMIAATIAFAIWGLTAPHHPYFPGEDGDVVVGVLAVVGSVILGVIGRFVGAPSRNS